MAEDEPHGRGCTMMAEDCCDAGWSVFRRLQESRIYGVTFSMDGSDDSDNLSISADEDEGVPPVVDEDVVFVPYDDDADDDELDDEYVGITCHGADESEHGEFVAYADVIDDHDHLAALGFTPENFDCGVADKELQAHIIAGLMARGEYLVNGLGAAALDNQICECAGIRLENLVPYVNADPKFASRFLKDKSAILFEPLFENVVKYTPADGHFKPNLTGSPALQALHDQILSSGMRGRERKEMAEKQKLDKMAFPENRKRYMITCNMLIEIMDIICHEKYKEEVGWQEVQDFYRNMMTSGDGPIFKKYKDSLQLDELRKTGVELNQDSTRILFGRGTVSKALSCDIFNKIKHEHNGKQLVVSFHEGYALDPSKFAYGEEDFKAIDEVIAKQNRPPPPPPRQRRYGGAAERLKKDDLERIQMEKRRASFNMPSLPPTYVPPAINKIEEERVKQNVFNDAPRAITVMRRDNDDDESDSSSSEKDTKNEFERYRGRKPSRSDDSVSSDGGRPAQLESRFSDDDEEERKAQAAKHEQRRREMEEKRQKAKQKGVATSESNRKASAFAAVNEYENFESEEEEQQQDPMIIASPSPRWDVPLKAETEQEKKERLENFVVTSLHQPPPSSMPRSVSRAPTLISDADEPRDHGERYSSLVEHPLGPRSSYNGQIPPEMSHRIAPKTPSMMLPPEPKLGSTRHEATLPLRSVGTQSMSVDVLLDELGAAPRRMTDPSHQERRDLFLSFIAMHVYCNRSPNGMSFRTWSHIKTGLEASLSMPDVFLGEDWISKLEQAIPKLQVVTLPDDYLFLWIDPADLPSRRPSYVSVFR